jgi:hypothetical protein
LGSEEQEVFEKEYTDMNWYKGNQARHMKEMEMGGKWSKPGELLFACPYRQPS